VALGGSGVSNYANTTSGTATSVVADNGISGAGVTVSGSNVPSNARVLEDGTTDRVLEDGTTFRVTE
jgi:hypothetical protein